MTAHYIERLAALRDGGRAAAHPADRPYRRRLASGLTIELAGPRVLADTFALPWLRERFDVFKSGAALLARPTGSTSAPTPLNRFTVAAELEATLRDLPERADAGRPYSDLPRFLGEAERPTIDAYLGDVVLSMRRLADIWKPPTAPRTRSDTPAKTATERKTAERERNARAIERTARAWLEHFLANDAEAGARMIAADLYEIADSDGFDTPDTPAECEPGPRQFYAVADEILGARRYSHGIRFYMIPTEPTTEEHPMHTDSTLSDVVLDLVADKLADEIRDEVRTRFQSGDRLGALTTQRDLAATGTHGAPIDFDAARTRLHRREARANG